MMLVPPATGGGVTDSRRSIAAAEVL